MAAKAKKSTSKTSTKKKSSKKQTKEIKEASKKSTTKKTATKKAATRKQAKKKTTTSSKSKKSSPSAININAEERWRMIATTAYLKAEARNFAPGHETDDWLEAENEVDALIKGKK